MGSNKGPNLTYTNAYKTDKIYYANIIIIYINIFNFNFHIFILN